MYFATPSQKLLAGFARVLRLFSRKNRIFWRSGHGFPTSPSQSCLRFCPHFATFQPQKPHLLALGPNLLDKGAAAKRIRMRSATAPFS
jgi:hypothetical protein